MFFGVALNHLSSSPAIRTFAAHEWAIYKDIRLRALADSPDAFGRTLAEEQDRSDGVWSNRLKTGATSEWDLPLLAEVHGEPAGLAWCHIDQSNPKVANLYQVWVAPGYRRLGIGKMLVDAAIAWTKAKKACYLELGVTWIESPARRLYTRSGFKPIEQPLPLRPESRLLVQKMRLEVSAVIL